MRKEVLEQNVFNKTKKIFEGLAQFSTKVTSENLLEEEKVYAVKYLVALRFQKRIFCRGSAVRYLLLNGMSANKHPGTVDFELLAPSEA